MQSTHATFSEQEGRAALHFERTLSHPPERVWDAITTHEELLDWHPTPFDLEPRVGGAVRFRPTAGSPEMPGGRVLAYEAPHRLVYTWGDDELRFELRPHESGCVISLTHLFDDRFKAARDGAGWHMCLDALMEGLDGRAALQRGRSPRPPAGWEELNRDYQQRFGIAPEQAAPLPPR
jgi:uncharacterized protein YndB with AHSA1/START domain